MPQIQYQKICKELFYLDDVPFIACTFSREEDIFSNQPLTKFGKNTALNNDYLTFYYWDYASTDDEDILDKQTVIQQNMTAFDDNITSLPSYISLTSGRLPENDNEIALNSLILDEMNIAGYSYNNIEIKPGNVREDNLLGKAIPIEVNRIGLEYSKVFTVTGFVKYNSNYDEIDGLKYSHVVTLGAIKHFRETTIDKSLFDFYQNIIFEPNTMTDKEVDNAVDIIGNGLEWVYLLTSNTFIIDKPYDVVYPDAVELYVEVDDNTIPSLIGLNFCSKCWYLLFVMWIVLFVPLYFLIYKVNSTDNDFSLILVEDNLHDFYGNFCIGRSINFALIGIATSWLSIIFMSLLGYNSSLEPAFLATMGMVSVKQAFMLFGLDLIIIAIYIVILYPIGNLIKNRKLGYFHGK